MDIVSSSMACRGGQNGAVADEFHQLFRVVWAWLGLKCDENSQGASLFNVESGQYLHFLLRLFGLFRSLAAISGRGFFCFAPS
jgi:hypothetical protein